MSNNISIIGPSLAGFLDRLGLPQATCDRVIAIDRELVRELESDHPDTAGCAALVLEAADLIADRDPAGFDWRGWDDDDDLGDVGDFDLDALESGEE